MTSPGAGAIAIEVDVAGGRVCSVAIRSSRPLGLTRLFVGRAGAETPLLARRIYTLCAQAQGAAASGAVALGERARDRGGRALRRRVERSQRTGVRDDARLRRRLAMDRRRGRSGGPRRRRAERGRARRARAPRGRRFGLAARAARGASGAARAPRRRRRGARRSLKLPTTRRPPTRSSARFLANASATRRSRPARPTASTRADDAAVVAALRGDPLGFAARPGLAGPPPRNRRLCAAVAPLAARARSILSARLAARLLDIRLALTAVGQGLQLGEMEFDDVLAAGAAGAKAGFGAVESARGRLYHWAEIGPDERISAYAIVAPTEWNFHPPGRSSPRLLGARVGDGEAARLAVSAAGDAVRPLRRLRCHAEGAGPCMRCR